MSSAYLEDSKKSSGDCSKNKSKSSLDAVSSTEGIVIITRVINTLITAILFAAEGEIRHPSLGTEVKLSSVAGEGGSESNGITALINIEAESLQSHAVHGNVLAVVASGLRGKIVGLVSEVSNNKSITSNVKVSGILGALAITVDISAVVKIGTENNMLDNILLIIVRFLGEEAAVHPVFGVTLDGVTVLVGELDVPVAFTLRRVVSNSSSDSNDSSNDSKSSHYELIIYK